MREVAPGVHQLRGFPPNAINVYLIGDVLLDSGSRFARRRILRQLSGHPVRAHALTHVHPDHQGSTHAICEELAIPLWCPEGDVDAMEDGRIAARQPDHVVNRISERAWAGPPHRVDQKLEEGDVVAGFQVLDTPGHSAGHVSYWRESDRVLILGDVLFNLSMYTGLPGLHEPDRKFTPDPARNRESARRLVELNPAVALFGHGPPLRDPVELREFVAGLAD
jgi:hydroxyacylglutathione hydrolase